MAFVGTVTGLGDSRDSGRAGTECALRRRLLMSALDVSRRFAVVALVLAMTAMGCASGGGGNARSTLRVGVAPNYPPVIFESDGQILGIEADFARIVADTLGRTVVFERYAFSELLDALERDEIDVVMSGLSITPERAERVRFTQPYMRVGQLALIRSRDIARFGRKRLIQRTGARVGYERGTSGERFVASTLTRAVSFGFDDVESGIRSLRAGRIDYFIHDAPTIWRLGGDPAARDLQGLYHPLTEENLAWAVRPENDQLRSLLDTTLAHWKREGLIEPIVDRWIPVRITVP